ncbi:hypothetical protein C1X35_25925 [Pseudomonas sp. FW306-1C-G01A]|uniref:hypothetical protein n=2 Tax=Pseudomonas TaxID=286 RepID=UPI000C86C58D|nr:MULTISPECIES: hypothetical protein [Pseudomonas]AVX93140.1 hypothetical protein PkP19E3_33910 [Pseudomonas koreensis]PMV85972.1 hypothetical protein C1X51_29710 [Pseudomonas sp. FW306-2-2C-B10A]PMW00637.1 hypothetical protein C1X50_28290 [Pseudomonas sp. MPR-TSA4]PMW12590.1 hypothetical protein C1X52_19245 [Pseudomonas sp. FW306-2-1A-C05A]MDC6536542.1 hypothetical protein [Pseudomonas syringae]
MNTPYQLESLYSERYVKSDLYRFLQSQSANNARGVIIPLNERGTRACLMLDSPTRRETLVSTGWSNQFLVIPAFHWRLITKKFNLTVIESDEFPATLQPAQLYQVARNAWKKEAVTTPA